MLAWPTHSFKNFGHKRNLPPSFLHSPTTPQSRIASTENFSKTAFHSWGPLSVCCLVLAVSLSSYIPSLPIPFFPAKYSLLTLYIPTLSQFLDFLANFSGGSILGIYELQLSALLPPPHPQPQIHFITRTPCVYSNTEFLLFINKNAWNKLW